MRILLAIIISTLILCSCNMHKVKYQSDIESVVKKAKNNVGELTQKDWELSDQKIEKFKEDFELKKNQMTKEERDKSNELIGKYSAIRLKSIGNQLKETISDLVSRWKEL